MLWTAILIDINGYNFLFSSPLALICGSAFEYLTLDVWDREIFQTPFIFNFCTLPLLLSLFCNYVPLVLGVDLFAYSMKMYFSICHLSIKENQQNWSGLCYFNKLMKWETSFSHLMAAENYLPLLNLNSFDILIIRHLMWLLSFQLKSERVVYC